MDGFRMTLGFSSNSSAAECADSEGADEGTILVRHNNIKNLTYKCCLNHYYFFNDDFII